MIKFEHTNVFNFDGAIYGMRNPLASWDKSDSKWDKSDSKWDKVLSKDMLHHEEKFIIGENDLDLMKRLVNSGSDHSKFMRQIMVRVDIDGPLYWWKEFDTYKVGTVANSESTMHCIHKKKFELSDFSYEHLKDCASADELLKLNIKVLNLYRNNFIETKDKRYWWLMIQLLPSSYNQMRTVTLNYSVIRNMYHSRKNHKLDEWSLGFTAWVESLPYANELLIS